MNIIAEKTLKAIDKQINSDNGAEFKKNEQIILPQMHDAYKADKKDGLRDHLGASVLGDECPRKVWLNYRGCGQSQIDARMIRLFNRGHLEEARFHAMLRAIGCDTLFEYEGRQYGYKDGMFAGSIDGLATNVPDCPNELVMLEFKTMNDSRFKQFVKSDLEFFKGYENQCKINMYCMCKYQGDLLKEIYPNNPVIWNTLFLAVNKNTDEIHAVIVHRDDDFVMRYMLPRIDQTLDNSQIPAGIHDSITHITCKMCSFNQYCYKNKELPHNCRTCSMFNCKTNTCELELEFSEDCYAKIDVEFINE